MTAPERRRPLPALAFIAALTVLTALVWFRVIHRDDDSADAAGRSCPSGDSTSSAPAKITVLPVEANVSVAVLNASNRAKLATKTKKLLEAKGFKVTLATNDDKPYGGHGLIKTTGEIRYGPDSKPAATMLHFYLPTAKMVLTDQSTPVIYLALGAKYKSLRTTAAVRTALVKAHITRTSGELPSADPSPSPSC